jgi:hypothetical protein
MAPNLDAPLLAPDYPGDQRRTVLGRPIAKIVRTFPELTNAGIKVCLQLGVNSPVHLTLDRIKKYLEQELPKGTERSREKITDLTRVGLDTLSIALSIKTDHQVDTKIADIGYDILQDAIKQGDSVMLSLQAKTIVAGLRKIAAKNDHWVDALLERRGDALEASIVAAREDEQRIEEMQLLAQSISALMTAATETDMQGEVPEIKFPRYWVGALRIALSRGCERQVDQILHFRSIEFGSAVNDEVRSQFRAQSLFKSEKAIFQVAISDSRNNQLVAKLTASWLDALNEATTYSVSAFEKVERFINSWLGDYRAEITAENIPGAKEISKAVVKLLLGAIKINKLKKQFADLLVRMIERVLERIVLRALVRDELLSSIFGTILEGVEAGDNQSILGITREELLLHSRAYPSVEREIKKRLAVVS